MTIHAQNPWETTTRSALIPLPRPYTHSLQISTSGPPRPSPSHPVLLFLSGGGSPYATVIRLQRLLSQKHRVYFYDRAGYDRSSSSDATTVLAKDSANELRALLTAIHVHPPYVLLAHSYGGIIAREFLDLMDEQDAASAAASPAPVTSLRTHSVAGMVLVDTTAPLLQRLFPTGIPPPAFIPVSRGIDFATLTHLRADSKFTDAEWAEALAATARSVAGAEAEDNRVSGTRLARKRQEERRVLGVRPLAVLACDMARDFAVVYEAGVEAGNGSDQERVEVSRFVEPLSLFQEDVQWGLVRLGADREDGGKVKFTVGRGCGHDVVMRKPEVVVREVDWVMGEVGDG